MEIVSKIPDTQASDVSDDEVLERLIQNRLICSGHTSHCVIEVTVREGEVILTGYTPTYYMKMMADSIALKITGVKKIINDIEVTSPECIH